MIKVSCLGDSIRMQYAPRVEELLGTDFEVFSPKENGRFAKYTLRGLFDWRKSMADSRIVHWNNGHWDINDLFGDGIFTSEEEYVANMLRIADLLQKNHDVVIFATTTPVRNENRYNSNSVIRRYNEIIVPLLRERGVLINDLNAALADDIDRYICEDLIHLTQEGLEICARKTAQCIREAARSLPQSSDAAPNTISQNDQAGVPVIFQ
ncbi:MAG: SGNH/GDSL hydrolase family protein [Clostridia bacterium]|nr:SGNH/GDSL hydrolase family protein [Clostridia bacterium]